jgi:hypothetical protein
LGRSEPTLPEWKQLARFICHAGGAVQWWAGDFLNLTERQLGAQGENLLSDLGWEPKTLWNVKDVAKSIETSRRREEISYSHHAEVADNTRWMRKPRTFSSVEEALETTARTYRRAVWDEQPVYVEVWTEKDALAGVLWEATRLWDVPLARVAEGGE